MSYGLVRDVLASSAFTAISNADHRHLVFSRGSLRRCLIIEELFDLVLGNYLDLEMDILSLAMRHMVSFTREYEIIQMDRNLIANRRLLNLLSSCRSYLDHVSHHVNELRDLDGSSIMSLQELKTLTHEEYDISFGYRVMEALRNYTQHQGFPITVKYVSRWTDTPNEEKSRLETKVIVLINISELHGFKASVLKELVQQGTHIDIRVLIRDYVGSLGKIHERIRDKMRKPVQEWENQVYEAIARFEREHPEEGSVGLMAVKRLKDGTYKDKLPIFKQGIEYRHRLEAKNRSLGTLARRYVTSE